ncbi:alpha/beta fold hydrolase [Arenimonas composti]|uniref:alpha/beta fold hydrolase n=1 Tax=Arenimonas composti TaxID=370776 RepID=UPI0005C16FAA|nr:alpha/beta fold hydrolase [Arenimonas composti]
MLTIVLLPGMDGTGTLFEPFTSALGHECEIQVVRYPATGALGYEALEEHARKALPTSGRFVVLGESFSGPIAVSIAASRPAGLVGLILCATFIRNPRPFFGPLRFLAGVLPAKRAPLAVLSAALLGRFATPQLRSALAAALSQVSGEALRARLRAVLAIDASEKLEAVSVPLLYLMATHDRVVPVSALKQIERVLPATQVVSVNAPHFLLQAAPIEAAAAVSEFIRPLHDAS